MHPVFAVYTANYKHVVFTDDRIKKDNYSGPTVLGMCGRCTGCYRYQKKPISAECDGKEHQ